MCNLDLEKCTGCGACFSICPYNAISMNENNEGFLYPIVDKDKCKECNFCINTCPIKLNNQFNESPLKYLAMQTKNNEILHKSSSGGVFYNLARYAISKKWYVCGASLVGNCVKHVLISESEDIYQLMGSKYVQSEIGNIFKEIKRALTVEKKGVLFVGTPCQVAGLKAFLKKDYDNFITVDLICHGVPSPGVFKKYLNYLNVKHEMISFRDKTKGWNNFHFVVKNDRFKVIDEPIHSNSFTKGFLENLYLRKSCGKCKYARLERCGDLTIGDFWGVESFHKQFCDDKGTSLVLLNTIKGKDYIDSIKKYFKFIETKKEYALKSNKTLSSSWSNNKNRKLF